MLFENVLKVLNGSIYPTIFSFLGKTKSHVQLKKKNKGV